MVDRRQKSSNWPLLWAAAALVVTGLLVIVFSMAG
jgi:hypothetical protein